MITTVSLEDYEQTLYRPDKDFLEGILQERLWGEFLHASTVSRLLFYLDSQCGDTANVLPSLRVRISPTRIRVADICLLQPGSRKTGYFDPPIACVEVLSDFETFESLLLRCEDYLKCGVKSVWIVDPVRRRVFDVTKNVQVSEQVEKFEILPGHLLFISELFEDD